MATEIITLDDRVKKLELDVAAIKKDTSELVLIFKNAKLGVHILVGLGKIAKWVGSVAVACIAIWALIYGIKAGIPPSLSDNP